VGIWNADPWFSRKIKKLILDSEATVLGFKQGTGDYFLLNLESGGFSILKIFDNLKLFGGYCKIKEPPNTGYHPLIQNWNGFRINFERKRI
jgi:hypothetical protein